MTERDFATDVVKQLHAAGFVALWAGGCVRDEQLGLTPVDYDIATNAVPDQVLKLFRRANAFGASFGVVEVLGPRGSHGQRLKVQVATFRSDGTYTDGRRPDSVRFSSPQEDAQRRDFTINGLFYDPLAHRLIDYVGGQRDLQARVLRAIGNPADRFREDKLRLLRAVRMATRFELSIDPDTLQAAQQMAPEITVVSVERIAEELRKLLVHRHRVRGLALLTDFKLLPHLVPELGSEPSREVVEVFARLAEPVTFELALATLLHQQDGPTAERVTARFKLSNDERQRIGWLVRHARALDEAERLRPARLYPLLVDPGIGELLNLHAARLGADAPAVRQCQNLLNSKPPEALNPPPLLTGDDLRQLGYQPGPNFKTWLQQIRDQQLDGDLTSREDALAWVAAQAKAKPSSSS